MDYQDEIEEPCYTYEELTKIDRETKLEFNAIYSYNFVDFESFDEPLKRRFSILRLGSIKGLYNKIFLPLRIGSISLDDNLVSPFESENAQVNYLYSDISDKNSAYSDLE